MKRWETRLFHVSTISVSVSGIVYFWMKYLMKNDDPFSVLNHPWQPGVFSLHVISAPALVFVVGLAVQSHIRAKLTSGGRSNRRSGVASMLTLPLMIVSGYFLQVVVSPFLTQVMLVLHLSSATVFVATYGAHQIVTLRLRKSLRERARRSVSGRQLA